MSNQTNTDSSAPEQQQAGHSTTTVSDQMWSVLQEMRESQREMHQEMRESQREMHQEMRESQRELRDSLSNMEGMVHQFIDNQTNFDNRVRALEVSVLAIRAGMRPCFCEGK
jgi:TRAP-type C4-dicarboxylate transport system substrate-binding protein